MASWQQRLFKISLMKREKVALISQLISLKGKVILDLGCANGVVSYHLKKLGGEWFHSDLEFENVRSARALLQRGLFQQPEVEIPLPTASMDCILCLDFLEHVDDDAAVIREIKRVLKKNGQVVISTPITGSFFSLNHLKKILGLTPEVYGHKREGYSLQQLSQILRRNGFVVDQSTTYAKFFVEFFEILLNWVFQLLNRGHKRELRTGSISPTSAGDLDNHPRLFQLYASVIYPAIYTITRLDKLLARKTGYATLVVARKE
jgi:2-polyprenyl-3-methyl-5-hydroxy-6-metoxy-1,4-benzoquinol methylase